MRSLGKLKIVLGVLLFFIFMIGVYFFYLYQRGGSENYRPPALRADSAKERALNDLTVLSQAVEAYYAKNLKYPEKIGQLQPEFSARIPAEPVSGKPYVYESDGQRQYRITVFDPTPYGLKDLLVENGKIVQK